MNRRMFIGATAVGALGIGRLQTAPPAAAKSIDTAVLTIGYEESGAPAGFPVILLHGFPDDVRAWDGVTPPLVKAGYRVFVPYLRGFGATRFRDRSAPRMAQ